MGSHGVQDSRIFGLKFDLEDGFQVEIVNLIMSQRALSPPSMTMNMTLTPLTKQNNKLAAPASQADLLVSNDGGSTTPSTRGKKNGRQIVGFLDAQKIMQH